MTQLRSPRALSRGVVALLALAALSACKSQDPAIHVTFNGSFIVPSSADQLIVDVLESQTVIIRSKYGVTAETPLPLSITFVQGDRRRTHVKFNAVLTKQDRVVGRGNIETDFVGGKTIDVSVEILPQ